MAPELRGNLQLDRCGGCNGLWFDRTELDRYLTRANVARLTSSARMDRLADDVLALEGWRPRYRAPAPVKAGAGELVAGGAAEAGIEAVVTLVIRAVTP